MGQIVSLAAKPKRCNLNKLSQLGTPAAGEHILVSSDNSMNAAGQGNFDCYIEGDGQKAATALELKSIASKEVTENDKNSVAGGAVFNYINSFFQGEDVEVGDFADGYFNTNAATLPSTRNSVANCKSAKLSVAEGEVYKIYGTGANNNYYRLYALYDANGNRVDRYASSGSYSTTPLELTIPSGVATMVVNLTSYNSETDKLMTEGKSYTPEEMQQEIEDANSQIDATNARMDESFRKIIFFSGNNIGCITAGDGKNNDSSSWRHSEFVPFEDDLTLHNIYIENVGGSGVGLCVYDAYKNYIGWVSAATAGWQDAFTLQKSSYPEAHYIRFSTTPAKNGYCFVNIANSFSRIIDELQKICINTYGNFFSIEGYLLRANGTIEVHSGAYVTDYIPIDITNDLIVYGYGYPTAYVPICYYDEKFQFLGNVASTKSGGGMELHVVSSENIPNGTKYIRCSANSKGRGFVITNVPNAIIKDLNSLRDYVNDNVGGSELHTIQKDFDFVANKYHYYTQNSGYHLYYGSESTTPGYHCTSLIPIAVGDVIISNCARGNAQLSNVYCDSDGQPIGRFDVGSATPSTFTIPQSAWDDGARFVALSFVNTVEPSLEIKHNYNAYNDISSIENAILKKVTFPSSSFYGKSPEAFKDKLIAAEQDIEILLLGDSMTARTDTAGPEFSDASHLPAGCNRDAITYQLWNLLCKNKPLCDRFDSVRDNSNVFTESGAWSLSSVDKQNYDDGVSGSKIYGEVSKDNCIYRESADSNAYVEFDWNLADYEKLYFIHRLSQCDGTTEVTISCAAGKVEVYDLQNGSWVEANGFTFSQKLTATGVYNARWIRNYPLKMRRKAVTDETVTIRLTNTGSGTFYYWGTERWNFTTLRITNIARAGRTIELLRRSIPEELSLRSVDLIIFQLPLWNNFGQISANGRNPLTDGAYPTLSSLTNILNDFKSLSDNFTKFQVICNLYHTSVYSWDGNKNLPFDVKSINVKTSDCDYNLEMQCAKHIKDYAADNNITERIYVANLIGELYRLVCINNSTMSYALEPNETHRLFGDDRLTVNGVHPTGVLFGLYANMISSMFEY